jgi:Domain of unknown function (DUF4382)
MQPNTLSNGANGGVLHKLDTFGGIGNMSVMMGDAPPWFSGRTLAHFYVGVREVDVIANGQATPVISLASPYVFDLLGYQDGSMATLGQGAITPGQYSQMRFVFDAASAQAIFSDGSTLPVTFMTNNGNTANRPGASTVTASDPNVAGAVDVTINAPITVNMGDSASFGVDFNALESMAVVNNNSLKIRPSLVGANTSASGKVTGNIVNQSGSPVQNVVVAAVASDGTIVNTALTGPYGRFNIHGINAGTYQIVLYNSYTTAAGQQYNASGQSSTATSLNGPSITVTGGGATDAGTLTD